MASAILLFYTSEGFLVAADGRARGEGVVLSDTVTKIFSITESRRSLVYAFGGSVALTDENDSEVILYDFRDEAVRAINSLKKSWYPDLPTYAAKLTKRLQNRLEKALQNERIEPLKRDAAGLVAALFLAGYYAKTPSAVVVQFKHEGQTLLPPLIRQLGLVKGYAPLVVYGSEVVRQQVFEMNSPEFSTYRVPTVNTPDAVTLTEVANVAGRYISACADPAAMKIDAEHCSAIGGHIHIAQVTLGNGFEWVVPPLTTGPAWDAASARV